MEYLGAGEEGEEGRRVFEEKRFYAVSAPRKFILEVSPDGSGSRRAAGVSSEYLSHLIGGHDFV